jgi:AraC-like DNA-binding protein
VPENHDWWLLVLTHTPATFCVDNQLIDYPNGSIVLYPPGCKIHYQACNGPYVNDWLRFYTTETYLLHTILPPGQPVILSNPDYCHKIFQLLTEEDFSNNEYKEHSIDALIRLLINKMLEAYTQNLVHTPQQKLLALRLDIKNNPGYPWTVPYMAAQVHFSEGHFQALYKQKFQVSCMEDVIQNRIRLAKELLSQSVNSIYEIGSLCGYQNLEHFSRQFKKITGQTPTEFRSLKSSGI